MSTLRSGRLYGSADPKPVPLPDEILLHIFEDLGDPFKLARIETVSRQWHRVARDHQHLWRDAIGIDMGRFECVNDKLISPAQMRHTIDTLCARSGGKLDRLALVLPIQGGGLPDVEDVEYILQLLPTLHLKELWFEGVWTDDERLGSAAPTCERREGYNKALSERFPALLDASLRRCKHLIKLFVDISHAHVGFTRSFAGTPLSSCRLKELSLGCHSIGALFDDDSLCDMLQSATHIRLQSVSGSSVSWRSAVKIAHLWRLLQRASATLEHVEVMVSAEPERLPLRLSYDQQSRIEMPQLQTLAFRVDPTGPIAGGALKHRFACPSLVHLRLDMLESKFFLQDIFEAAEVPLQTLSLGWRYADTGGRSVSGPKSYARAIVGLLSEHCAMTLQRLTVANDAAAELVEELSKHPTMILDTITVTKPLRSLRFLVKFAQSRLSSASYRPIRDVAFVYNDNSHGSDKIRRQLAWLRRHVAVVVACESQHQFSSYNERLCWGDRDTKSVMERRPSYFTLRQPL